MGMNVIVAIQVTILMVVGITSIIGIAGEVGILNVEFQRGTWQRLGTLGGAAIAFLFVFRPKMLFGMFGLLDSTRDRSR